MREILLSIGVCSVALMLVACGGGGGSSTASISDERLSFPRQANRHYGVGGLSAPTTADARQMPIYHDGRHLVVGVDQGTGRIGGLPTVSERGDVTVRHGRLSDGVGSSTLSVYLADAVKDGRAVRRYASSPQVRSIGSATAQERARLVAAVQLVNAALPAGAKMRVGSPLPGFSLRDTVSGSGRRFVSGNEHDNTIHVEFLSCAAYYGCPGGSGATTWNHPRANGVANSYIQMSRGVPAYNNPRWNTILLAHEMLHALGLYSGDHVSVRFDTIMEATNDIYDTAQGIPQPLSLLYPVDREAMRALYGRLGNGDSPTSFGPWESSSWHVVGVGKYAAFGVRLANGYAEPWAYGRRPATTLANNRSLSGSATWEGSLLGLTPSAEAVAGDAEIGVNLTTMRGAADFTALESWAARSAPGEAGTGTQWLDGDLGYTISVRGNTFKQTGGDAGTLTGIFVGRSHEGAAGTLERSDLTAAFGASR